MHLVSIPAQQAHVDHPYCGLAFSLAITDADSIAALREAGHGRIALAAPFHMSEDDAYLIVPDDIGLELIDIMRDGDSDLLHEALRDGLLAVGQLARGEAGMELSVERCITPSAALKDGLPHVERVELEGTDPVRRINQLGHVQCTTLSALVNDEGLEQMLRSEEHLGHSWTLDPALEKRLGQVEPTYVWSRRVRDGVSVEMALFSEDDEVVVLMRPLLIGL